MPAVPIQPRVKHRAAATRRVPRTRASDSESAVAPDPEPNMRLSRAILVMLLLHVVAVGGILAFSLIKEHGRSHAVANPTSSAVEAEDSDTPPKVESRDNNRSPVDPSGALTTARTARSNEPITRVANEPSTSSPANDAAQRIASGGTNGGNQTSTPPPNAEKNGRLPSDSGKTYAVKKGDSPFTIADRFKVDAAVLLKLNGIDDPKKLKPGQVLKIPTPAHSKPK